ncbi:microtubule-associated protein futsch [Toxorhynchites rutilus septentrionalis]|uniref:microtubule-associated protein futsch n=1 Tax=Toxorhynchites rutilus septentrionalis TaxID=329112 RepID=UPI0024790351|nr:microtubule-associated protein futsch [Toxorhynchites rutilus septentrionalis]XP_055625123.1 microtubule-associated protein futsch [Toxorhynchites rutilus septentrionalis]XP_055625124.1 microtubule-associated protein futsch [Toxorhynchites rutilus septentrionalis]XP_055625125.1 microtubule-associated protein futsch [Toxorhynchites rutilus septentrionalis]XP_055625127.1 microtubule-associated protein futsch [Toxorhynchites rutilus septentrionalis]XP_055625128.1 microtubule-associated protein
MMEVNQPIATNALELSKMSTSVSETETLKDAEIVKQNGTSKHLEPDSEITNGFSVEDAMGQLMYSDSEENLCGAKKEADQSEADASETELVQNISTNLIEDIIQLGKDAKRTSGENGTQEAEEKEEGSELPPPSVQSSERSGPEEETTTATAVCAIEEDTLIEADDDLPETVSDVELGLNESVLLEEDDTAGENLLLVSGKEEGEGTLQSSAIQIEDSVVIAGGGGESIEVTLDELTDNSMVTIDESGLSILNTAAVDIGDMTTVDDSVKSVDEMAAVASAKSEEQSESVMEVEEMITSSADDSPKDDDDEKMESTVEETGGDKLNKSQIAAEIEDLITFQDIDKVEVRAKTPDNIAEHPKSDSDESEIVKLPDETMEEEAPKVLEPDVSDLIKFDSLVDAVEEKKPSQEEANTEKSDLEKLPEESAESVSDETEKDSSESKKETSDEISEGSPEESLPKASNGIDQEKQSTTETEKKDDESKSDASKKDEDACPQALQAADEEDLLEMMEEPAQMDPDEENLEEDGDDNSSESGSAKRSQEDEGDDEEEEEEETVDDDESSRNAGDDTMDVQTAEEGEELTEGEPPVKKKCSIDLREAENDMDSTSREPEHVVEKEKEDKEEEESIDQPKPDKLDEKCSGKANEEDKVEDLMKEVDELLRKDENKVAESVETSVKQNTTSKESVPKDVEPESMEVCDSEPTSEKKAEGDSEENVTRADSDEKKSKPETAEKESIEKEEAPKKTDEMKVDDDSSKDTNAQKKISASVSDQDEVFLIDDDDDIPVKDDKSQKPVGKRPCPDDKGEAKEEELVSAKKIRLSTEKKEDSAEPPKDKPESLLESIEPLKVSLTPEPEASKEKKTIRMDFMNKFLKPLERMNRSNLEEFVLQKIVEGIAFKSSIAEMRTQLDAQDTLLQGYRQKVHDLKKQFKDLEMVHERVVKDLEKKNQHFITPVKITRAVGLQVSQPRFVPANRPSVGGNASGNSTPKGPINRSPASTPGTSPNKNTNLTKRLTYSRVSPMVVKAKTSIQPTVVNKAGTPATVVSKTVSNSPVNKAITPLPSQASNATVNNAQPPQPAVSTSPSPAAATTTTTTAGTPALRKKPLQKFTPMRPPLSITQQVQQQQQTRQMQEQLVRQQIQEVQTSGSQPQSPATQSPQGSPLTQTPEPTPGPVEASPARIPPIVVKKITPQAKGTPGTMQIINRQTPSMVTAATNVRSASAVATTAVTPASAAPTTVDNSLIDLTDEDDVPKAAVVRAQTATVPTAVVPRPPITLLNGQQQQYVQRQNTSMPPLVVINQQQRMVSRPMLQQRPAGGGTIVTSTRPMLMQRPGNVINGLPRAALAGQQTYKPRMMNGQIDPSRRIVARAPIRQPAASFVHPAPLPQPGAQPNNGAWKHGPPRPSIRINNIETGIVISWTMDDLSDNHATIVSYQIYAYQETAAPPSVDMWRHVGDVKAMLLPMAVTLTQFQEGQRYHFAVRAVDEHQRVGHFSPPRTWNESAPGKA